MEVDMYCPQCKTVGVTYYDNWDDKNKHIRAGAMCSLCGHTFYEWDIKDSAPIKSVEGDR